MNEVFVRTPVGWYWGCELSRDERQVTVQVPQNAGPTLHAPHDVRCPAEHLHWCVDLWAAEVPPTDLELCAGTLSFAVPRAVASEAEAGQMLPALPNPRAEWAPTHTDGVWCWTSHGEANPDFTTADDAWWLTLQVEKARLTKRLRRRMTRPTGKGLRK